MRDCRKHQAVWMVVVLLKKQKKNVVCLTLSSPALASLFSHHNCAVVSYSIWVCISETLI